jgi:hypothetical protein
MRLVRSSVPRARDLNGLPRSVVLIEKALARGRANDARRKLRAVLARKRGSRAGLEFRRIEMATARDAVNVLMVVGLCGRGPRRRHGLALTLRQNRLSLHGCRRFYRSTTLDAKRDLHLARN